MTGFEDLNKTELLELIRHQTGRRLSRKLNNNELIEILNTGILRSYSETEKTRLQLEQFIDKNWEYYQTNLPCKGQVNEGKCTIYKCPEARHIGCYLAVKKYLK